MARTNLRKLASQLIHRAKRLRFLARRFLLLLLFLLLGIVAFFGRSGVGVLCRACTEFVLRAKRTKREGGRVVV